MIKGFGQADAHVAEYFDETFHPEDEILAEIRERSKQAGLPPIQVGKADARHLEVLIRMTGAKKVAEIGTLGGYSGVCIARALPPEGVLHTFELNQANADVARESFRKAGVADKIKLHVGPALRMLPTVVQEGPFDVVFIDADKVNYPNYLRWAYENLRIGGTVIGDNCFAWGLVAKGRIPDPEHVAAAREVKNFNREIATNGAFASTILPTEEGLAIAVKIR